MTLAAAGAAADDAVVERFEVTQPRAAGYQLGDRFERVISLRLREPWQLSTDTLKPGRVNYWLSLAPPSVTRFASGAATDYELRLGYQVVNDYSQSTDVPVPSHQLTLTNGTDTTHLLVRPVRTELTPLVLPQDFVMRDDRPPQPLPPPLLPLLLSWFVLLAAALGLAMLYWRIPLGARRQPFTRAYATLKQQLSSRGGIHDDRDLLATLHGAFNDTAGYTVFEQDVAAFVAAHDRFGHLGERIGAWFGDSRRRLYANDAAALDRAALLELARELSDAERGVVA